MVKSVGQIGALALLGLAAGCLPTPTNVAYVYACPDGRDSSCPPGQVCQNLVCYALYDGGASTGSTTSAGSSSTSSGASTSSGTSSSSSGTTSASSSSTGGTGSSGSSSGSSSGTTGAHDGGGCIAQFQTALALQAGQSPAGLAVGDFNADGLLDVLVVDSSSGFVVLQNRGGGALTQNAGLTLSDPGCQSFPASAAAGDFNGDGFADVVLSFPDINSLALLLNDRDGGFGTGPTGVLELDDAGVCEVGSPAPFTPLSAIHLDGGWSVVALDVSGTFGNGGVSIAAVRDGGHALVGAGNYSSFADAPNAFALSRPLAAGGFDLAVAVNPGQAASRLDPFTVPAHGDPMPLISSELTAGHGTASVRYADMNGDGFDDLVFVNTGDDTVSIAYGLDGGGFNLRLSSFSTKIGTGGSAPADLVVADLDRDGLLDVATVNDHSVTIFAGDRDAGLIARQLLNTSAAGAMFIVGADFATDAGTAPASLVVSYAPGSTQTAVDFFQTSCH